MSGGASSGGRDITFRLFDVQRSECRLDSRQLAAAPTIVDRLVGESRSECAVRPGLAVGQGLAFGREPEPVVSVMIVHKYLGDKTHGRDHTGAALDRPALLMNVRSA